MKIGDFKMSNYRRPDYKDWHLLSSTALDLCTRYVNCSSSHYSSECTNDCFTMHITFDCCEQVNEIQFLLFDMDGKAGTPSENLRSYGMCVNFLDEKGNLLSKIYKNNDIYIYGTDFLSDIIGPIENYFKALEK